MKYIKTYESINGITFKQWLKSNKQGINTNMINCVNSNLIDLIGIEIFINLERLYCRNNQLISLPNLSNLTNLKVLDCDNNQLTSLPNLSNLTNLERLYCYNNKLPYNNLRLVKLYKSGSEVN